MSTGRGRCGQIHVAGRRRRRRFARLKLNCKSREF